MITLLFILTNCYAQLTIDDGSVKLQNFQDNQAYVINQMTAMKSDSVVRRSADDLKLLNFALERLSSEALTKAGWKKYCEHVPTCKTQEDSEMQESIFRIAMNDAVVRLTEHRRAALQRRMDKLKAEFILKGK